MRETEAVHTALSKVTDKITSLERKHDNTSSRLENYKGLVDRVEALSAALALLHTAMESKADMTDVAGLRRIVNQLDSSISLCNRMVDEKVDMINTRVRTSVGAVQTEVEKLKVIKCDEDKVEELLRARMTHSLSPVTPNKSLRSEPLITPRRELYRNDDPILLNQPTGNDKPHRLDVVL